jgi:hypothetical protein
MVKLVIFRVDGVKRELCINMVKLVVVHVDGVNLSLNCGHQRV